MKKEKNYEVNLENIVETLSKVGMSLEKRLSYIYTKNKSIKDENILMRCVYNQQYKDVEDMFVSPAFLGLRPAESSVEESSREERPFKFEDSYDEL